MSIILSLALVWAFAIVPASAAPASAAPTAAVNYAALTPNEKLVYDYITSTGNWPKWVSYYAPSIRSTYLDFIESPSNQANDMGILTIKNARVLGVQKLNSQSVPKYRELDGFYESGNYEYYEVETELSVNKETKYFQNGSQDRLVTLVNDSGKWYVGASAACHFPKERGVGQGFLDGDLQNPPSTICIDQHDGSTWKIPSPVGNPINVNFDDFVVNTVCGEISSANKNDAVIAVAVADRMFGWWCVLGSYRDTFGCDLVGGFDVNYNPNRDVSNYPSGFVSTIESALNKYVVSSDGKFFSVNVNNYTKYDYAGSGDVVQSGANQHAKDGDTWEDILHYYLDYSTLNWTNAGIVQVGSV